MNDPVSWLTVDPQSDVWKTPEISTQSKTDSSVASLWSSTWEKPSNTETSTKSNNQNNANSNSSWSTTWDVPVSPTKAVAPPPIVSPVTTVWSNTWEVPSEPVAKPQLIATTQAALPQQPVAAPQPQKNNTFRAAKTQLPPTAVANNAEHTQAQQHELNKQTLYKTELCRSWIERGTCKYGHKCQFAHGEEELRVIVRHPKYKTELCKTFVATGHCPYGNRCRFIHPPAVGETNAESNVQSRPQQSANKNIPSNSVNSNISSVVVSSPPSAHIEHGSSGSVTPPFENANSALPPTSPLGTSFDMGQLFQMLPTLTPAPVLDEATEAEHRLSFFKRITDNSDLSGSSNSKN